MQHNDSKQVSHKVLTISEYQKLRSEAIDALNLLRRLDYHFYGTNKKKNK